MSRILLDPNKLSPEICHTRLNEKSWSLFFFMGDNAFFSEICVFSNILGVAEKVL